VLLTTTIYDSFAYFITPSPVSSLSLFFLLILPPPRSTLFPYTTLFRSALGDCETVGELVERNGRSRLELACGHAGVSELRRERHRETAGVRRGEELFGVSADPILKPRAERVLRLLQHTTIRRNRALPIFQTALPNRGRLALHGFSPCAPVKPARCSECKSHTVV